jgi:rhodanese-related sulfurtransferase
MMKSQILKLFSLILLLLIGTIQISQGQVANTVEPKAVRQWQVEGKNFLLIDIRPQLVFELKYIEGAINIPGQVVASKRLPKNVPIVIYSWGISTKEADEAATALMGKGYDQVYVLEGGLSRWDALGFPVVAKLGVVQEPLGGLVSPERLHDALLEKQDLMLIDLRGPKAFKEGHIPGAVEVLPDRLEQFVSGIGKNKQLVLYDDGEGVAEAMAEKCRRSGFKLVHYLNSGFPGWQKKGYASE